ncbi:TrkH family potassium uptake protein [Salsipaludibacter albus]|uniref:TrkH family potassium uptake protein n=1 Tax=Salsipaludibacter albus TaxID=2849650 RepID=UPI001EE49371|nr:potassium transporter TrkG [Salsipaludibacter albus]MBY5162661.1 hypothetical protein [Salsipaludibacter albus]
MAGILLTVRPSNADLLGGVHHLGRLLAVVGYSMLAPLAVGVALREWRSVTALATSVGVTLLVAALLERLQRPEVAPRLTWGTGAATVAVTWLVAPAFGTLPLWLTGVYSSGLDAYFDGVSALTTSGLSLALDLDHLPQSLNLWRHLMQFLGGQGIVIVAFALATSSGGNLSTLSSVEGRQEPILPNVVTTARFIARVAGTYLAFGTLALWAALLAGGFTPVRGLLHAADLAMAAFSTGGFAPMSTSVGYYHSISTELVLSVLMLAGAASFHLHFQLWRHGPHEITRNSEFRTMVVTLTTLTAATVVGLAATGTYHDVEALLRKGAFTALSAHTTTGFAVVAGPAYETQWGVLVPALLVIAMAIGAMGASTGGGIKVVRVMLAAKAVGEEIRRALLPDAAVVVSRYHAGQRRLLSDRAIRSATLVGLLFLGTYLLGSLVALGYGYGLEQALFESTSATATIGLTSGLLAPDIPALLKVTYIVQMWLGRLEFMACFVLAGYLLTILRTRRP